MEETSGTNAAGVTRPTGDGGLHSLGERFQPDLLRGTGGYEVPLQVPAGPGETRPSLSLRYSTGLGNGSFGMGWELTGLLEVRRRTDLGVPRYGEHDEFQLAGGEVLVPVGDDRFRPQVETSARDIRRVDEGWRIRTADGVTYELGGTPESRIESGGRVFAWRLTRQTSPSGVPIEYIYEGVGPTSRLVEVRWGTYALRFRYEARPDVLRNGRAGFEQRTDQRCVAIERYYADETEPTERYDLRYEETPATLLSVLVEISRVGFDRDGNAETHPSVEFGYTSYDPSRARYREIEGRGRLPPLDDPAVTMIDMTGDARPDILDTRSGDHVYWPNEGAGSFGSPVVLETVPASLRVGTPGVTFAEMDGDGAVDLLDVTDRVTTIVRNTGMGGWEDRPVVVRNQLPLSLEATDTRLVDVDGDGRTDLLQTGSDGLLWTYNQGDGAWSRPETSRFERRASNRAASSVPDVSLDRDGVYVTDMTGDGLQDVVTIEPGRVTYWPSFGRGQWGERITMQTPPRFEDVRRFSYERLFVSDIDGDGTTDLIYVDGEQVFVWLNRTGNGWSDRMTVPFVPPPDTESTVLVDLYGTGTRGLLWQDTRRRDIGAQYRYLDLTDGRKPYLLTAVDNGFGLRTDVTYRSSATIGTSDPTAGYLPFPVHTVASVTETDGVTGRVHETQMSCEEGYFDPIFREFRGFKRVSLTEVGDDQTPTIVQETRFTMPAHAAPSEARRATAEEQARERALTSFPAAIRTYELVDGEHKPIEYAATDWKATVVAESETDGVRRFVQQIRMERSESRRFDEDGDDLIETASYQYDEYGNITRKRYASRFENQPVADAITTEERFTYTSQESSWLVGLPTEQATYDQDGRLVRRERRYYDGPEYEGLPLGEVTEGRVRRVEELFLATDLLPDQYADDIDPEWGLRETDGGYVRERGYAHDAIGNVVAIRESGSVERTIKFDDAGLFPVRSAGPEGTTQIEFDPRIAQPTEIRTPDGIVVRYEYTPIGRLHAQYDTVGYDRVELTRVFVVGHFSTEGGTVIPPHLVSVKPTTDGRNPNEFVGVAPESISNAAVTVEYYDSIANPLQQCRRASETNDRSRQWILARKRRYTVRGEPAEEFPNEFVETASYQSQPSDHVGVRFEYGPGGQFRRLELGDGRSLLAEHHPSYVEQWKPSMIGADPRVQRYDATGRLTSVEEPASEAGYLVTSYEVDIDGRPTEILDAAGRQLATYTYAGLGPAVRIEHVDAGVRHYWYDAAERLRLRTDSLGRRLRYSYDTVGRIVSVVDESTSPPARLREWTYDGQSSRPATVTDGDISTTYEYDAVGRETAMTVEFSDGESRTVQREFGRFGELRSLIEPRGRRVVYEYDGSGHIKRVSGVLDSIELDEADAPTELAFAGGSSIRYSYDPPTRQLQTAELISPHGSVRKLEHEYGIDGALSQVSDSTPEETTVRQYAYDERSQLESVTVRADSPDGPIRDSFTYRYGPTGDIVRNDEAITGPIEYDGVAIDGEAVTAGRPRTVQFTGEERAQVRYDAAGRTTAIGNRRLEYDTFDRLVKVSAPDIPTLRFDYDAFGNRVETRIDDRRIRVLGPYEETPDEARLTLTVGRLPIAMQLHDLGSDTRSTIALFVDSLGSTMSTCSLDGSDVHHQTFTSYGIPKEPVRSTDRFAGGRGDPVSGIVQFGNRPYLPALGRFLVPDWFVITDPAQAMDLPLTLNPYAYSVNNPTTVRDPSGRFIQAALFVGVLAGLIVGGSVAHQEGIVKGLERGIETAILTFAGTALGALTGGLVGMPVLGGVIGGLNGMIGGGTENYSRDPAGLRAFLLDSSWGLAGTGLGLVLHGINQLIWRDEPEYNWELSRRQNRHVYEGGFDFGALFGGEYATTLGNVISSLDSGHGELLNHESLHVWQSRTFGPVFTGTYIGWLGAGVVIGTVVTFHPLFGGRFQSWGENVETFAYYNNPWEVWAYHHEGPGEASPGNRWSLV